MGFGEDMSTGNETASAMRQALEALMHEMKYVLCCINLDIVPFDGDDFHEALRLGKEALAKQEQGEPVVGTKTWFEDGKVVTQNLYYSDVYTTPQPVTESHKRKPLITEAMLDEFLEDYEMIGESEDGREACYAPNENDKALIKDAMFGLLQFADEAAHGIKE